MNDERHERCTLVSFVLGDGEHKTAEISTSPAEAATVSELRTQGEKVTSQEVVMGRIAMVVGRDGRVNGGRAPGEEETE